MRSGISFRLVAVQVLFLTLLLSSDALLRNAVAQDAGKTHLFFVTNTGCAPCRQVEPHIEALHREGYPVTTVYYDQHRQWANRHGVDRTPTVLMITNNKIVGRHAGLIDGVTLKNWFATQGIKSGSAFANAKGKPEAGGTKVILAPPKRGPSPARKNTNRGQTASEFSSPTMIKGTSNPGNAYEQLALQATVRLRVEDPDGTSYATGTVIHSHQGECLVVTCGHVFRDAQGKGQVSAEYGFDQGSPKTAPGELIFYDADARDIGLVAIRPSHKIVPVPIANRQTSIDRGHDIFSVGCDHGESPTIRRSRIKNRAAYSGAIKYDIYGRPVYGRSGGGLFTKSGELIGVCNAAAVEVDEGIYTSLDTIYWQLAHVNLEYLFTGQTMVAAAPVPQRQPVAMPVAGTANQTFTRQPELVGGFAETERTRPSTTRLAQIPSRRNNVAWENGSQMNDGKEVIITIRSKQDPSETETITISDPTPKLLDFLDGMNSAHVRPIEVARLRTEIPD